MSAPEPSQPSPDYTYPSPGYPRPARRELPLVVGVVVGLVVGAGSVGLAWSLSGPSGVAADAEAVCEIVEHTDTPAKDTPLEELQRWSVADVGVSLGKRDPDYKPLADALKQVIGSIRNFDEDKMKGSTDKVRELCADL